MVYILYTTAPETAGIALISAAHSGSTPPPPLGARPQLIPFIQRREMGRLLCCGGKIRHGNGSHLPEVLHFSRNGGAHFVHHGSCTLCVAILEAAQGR